MKKRLFVGFLFSLVVAAIGAINYFAFSAYSAIHPSTVCSLMQTTSAFYLSMGQISILLFFIGALVFAIGNMLACTGCCLYKAYIASPNYSPTKMGQDPHA